MNMTEALGNAIGYPVETACKLIESLLGKPFEIAGDALADQFQMWQWQNRLRIVDRANEIMVEHGIEYRVLPPDFFLPLIRDCGDTSDEELQDAWARLLSSAVADESNEHIAFLHTLKQFAPADVKVLNCLIEIGYLDRDARADTIAERLGLSVDIVRLSIHNFEHLGFFTPTGKRLKKFAIRFIRACTAKHDSLDRYVAMEKEVARAAVMD